MAQAPSAAVQVPVGGHSQVCWAVKLFPAVAIENALQALDQRVEVQALDSADGTEPAANKGGTHGPCPRARN